MDIDELRSALGAVPPSGTIQVTLFVPSVTRSGEQLDQERWRDEALAEFGRLFRGATAYPPGRGVWRDDEADGALLFEDVVIVFSIVPAELLDDLDVVDSLAEFLRRLRVEGDQGEVGLLVGEFYLGITDDPTQEKTK